VTDGRPPSSGHYTLLGVVRSEWTKLRSVRSTVWTLAITVVGVVGIGALSTYVTAQNWDHAGFADRVAFDPTARSLAGLFLGQIALGVLGVLVMSAEHTTGTIRATLAAAPRRWMVLVGKVVVYGAVAVVTGEVITFAAFELGQRLLEGTTPYATLSQPGVLSAVLGAGLILAVLGLFALGLATIIRHTAGAIAAFVGLLLVLPLVIQAFPASVSRALDRYMPLIIAEHMASTRLSAADFGGGPLFGPWAGFGLLCLYTVVTLALGCYLLERRDA
jgi:ABC-2 type transport system permease protein